MEVLKLEKAVLGDAVVKVLPQGHHGMSNVAALCQSRLINADEERKKLT